MLLMSGRHKKEKTDHTTPKPSSKAASAAQRARMLRVSNGVM